MNAPPCRAVLSNKVTHTPVRSSVLLCVPCLFHKTAKSNTKPTKPIIGHMLSSIGTRLVPLWLQVSF
jgi:hypothetical protein